MSNRGKNEESIIKKEERAADGLVYKYELVMRRSDKVASYALPLYSISVELSRENGEVITGTQMSEVFSNERKALDFFAKIVDNLATPIDLPYVLEDMLTI